MKKYLFIAAAAVAMLASCSQSDDLSAPVTQQNTEDNAVQFGTYIGKGAGSRAVTATSYTSGPIANAESEVNKTKSLAQARFGVFSYLTKADYTTSTALAPNFMYNQEIQYDNVLSWIYSPVKYWPNGIDAANTANNPSNSAEDHTTGDGNQYGKNLSFFAYAPYIATPSTGYDFSTDGAKPTAIGDNNTNDDKVKKNGNSNGIVAMTTNASTTNVWLKYLMPNATELAAVDLLWGLRGSGSYAETDGSASTGTVGTDYNMNLTKETVDERVSFLFKHALAKIGGSTTTSTDLTKASAKCGFMVKLDVDGNTDDNQTDYFPTGFNKAKTLVTVKNVKIQDGTSANSITTTTTTSDIFNSGWFNIETGTWDMTGATKTGTVNIEVQNDPNVDITVDHDPAYTAYTINPKIREVNVKNATGVDWNPSANSSTDGYTGGAEGVEVEAKPLFADEYAPAIMLIPGNATQTLYITIDYLVRTADANLATGYTEVEQVITNKVELPNTVLAYNKVYKIIMHLGLTSVKFEAVVSDWQTKTDSDVDTSGHETGGSSDAEEHIWLPSNVVTP